MSDSDNNYLEMSDEDIMNIEIPSGSDEPEMENDDLEADQPVVEQDAGSDGDVPDGSGALSESDVGDEAKTEDESENPEGEADVVKEENEETDPAEKDAEPEALTAESQLAELFAPFKANGKDIKIESIDEARTLMQMGANYAKKMTALKPNLKVLKMLENNNLLDEGKLSHLIDISKKNPEAIAKLLSDSGVDPMNVDLSIADEYKPGTYTVDDNDMAFDDVMERIKSTPAYSRTVDVIANKWDDSSKKILLEEPAVIEIINSHIASGVYDQIMTVVDKERMLGRMTGLSDIAAYKAAGEKLFGSKQPEQEAPVNVPKQAVVIKKAVVAPVEDPAVKARKQAAAPTKNALAPKPNSEFNPLALSDDEFMKLQQNGSKY